MEVRFDGVEVLVPTLEAPALTGVMAPRLTTLDGKVIGLLSNRKPHGDDLLRMIVDDLKAKYQIKNVILEGKIYHGNVAPKEMIDKLAQSCDAVITGIGD